MSSIYLPANLKARLIRAARRHGFVVERGRQSQLTEFIFAASPIPVWSPAQCRQRLEA